MECLSKERRLFLDKHLPMSLKRKVFNQRVLPAMTYGCRTRSLTKTSVKKLKINQRAMERKMLNVKLKDRIRNTIIRQKTNRQTEFNNYITNAKWKSGGHIARIKDNRWTIRSTEWQTKIVRSAERPKCHWKAEIVGQQGPACTRTSKDRENRTLAEGCGRT